MTIEWVLPIGKLGLAVGVENGPLEKCRKLAIMLYPVLGVDTFLSGVDTFFLGIHTFSLGVDTSLDLKVFCSLFLVMCNRGQPWGCPLWHRD